MCPRADGVTLLQDSRFDLICVRSRIEMCAQGCVLIRERACGRRRLRTLACAHDSCSQKMLRELLPTVKAVTFQKGRRYPVIFQEKKTRFECVKEKLL